MPPATDRATGDPSPRPARTARQRLVDATYEQRLAEVAAEVVDDVNADDDERRLARRAVEACAAIEAALAPVDAVVVEACRSAGVEASLVERATSRQNHTVVVRAGDVDDAERIAAALEARGFDPWERWTRGARRSFRRSATRLTVARTGAETTAVRVEWGNPGPGAGWRGLVHRLITPTAGDWSAIDLPAWAWRGYVVVRPIRQLAERLGLRRRHHATLGPFLATPDALLPPLFDLAEIGPDDHVVDLGCGDGRIVVAAAAERGCRGTGVEHDAALVMQASRRAVDAGVADLVEIVQGDARTIDLSAATCVFLFLPTDVTADLLGVILDEVPNGARVIAHEQSRPMPTAAPPPDRIELVVGDGAVTVARRWDV